MKKVERTPELKQIAKENQRLLKNIKRRVKTLESKYGETIATKKFASLKNKTTRNLSAKELREQRRDLLYINNLKTSTVRGFKSFKKNFESIAERMTNKDFKDLFWDIYGKMVEENKLLEKYKYELFDSIEELINDGINEDKIIEKLHDLYNEDYIENKEITIEDALTISLK